MFPGSRRGRSTAAPATANLFGLESLMNDEMKERRGAPPERRAFFGQLFATIGGGILAGSFLRGLLGSHKRASNQEHAVSISVNPLAVPRTKEGSKSNV